MSREAPKFTDPTDPGNAPELNFPNQLINIIRQGLKGVEKLDGYGMQPGMGRYFTADDVYKTLDRVQGAMNQGFEDGLNGEA